MKRKNIMSKGSCHSQSPCSSEPLMSDCNEEANHCHSAHSEACCAPVHHCHQHKEHLCGMSANFQEIFHCLVEVRHQTQVAHWTVGGGHFGSWHEMYGKHYEQLQIFIDDFVEMLLIHDVKLMDCAPACGRILETHCAMGSRKKMMELMEHMKGLIGKMESVLSLEPRMCVQDVLVGGVKILEKQVWFYKNSLI